MSNVVGDRFQITIDKRVRDQLGISPGDRAIERVEDGRMVVTFMPAPHRDSLLGIFRRPDLPPIADWDSVKDRAWAHRTSELLEAAQPDSAPPRADRPR
jgi:AbrB family looped-hinge helix DNA binding protein